MGDATAWDIFIIFVLLFVIFGRRLMPGIGRGLFRAVTRPGPAGREPAEAKSPILPESAAASQAAESAGKPVDDSADVDQS